MEEADSLRHVMMLEDQTLVFSLSLPSLADCEQTLPFLFINDWLWFLWISLPPRQESPVTDRHTFLPATQITS